MPELMKPEAKMSNLRTFFDKNKDKLQTILPRHFSLDRQGQILFTTVFRSPALLDCTPASLVGCLIQGGTFGLEPVGPGGYWLVPFRKSGRNGRPDIWLATMIVDYRGLMGMARRTKQVKVVDWRAVRAGDNFDYEYGSRGFIHHKPSQEPAHQKNPENPKETLDRAITHCYAYGVLDSGATVFEVMTIEDVRWHRDRYSRAAGNGPWVTNEDEMGAKTCVRKLADKLPFDPLLSQAVIIDNKTEQNIEQNFGDLLGQLDDEDDRAGGSAGSTKLDKVTEELKARDAKAGAAGQQAVDNSQQSKTAEKTVVTGRDADGTIRLSAADTNADRVTVEVKPDAKPSDGVAESTAGDPGKAGAVPATEAAAVRDPGSAATQPASGNVGHAGAGPSRLPTVTQHGLIDAINALNEDIGITGPANAGKRQWLWDRFVGGGYTVETAPLDKLEALKAELERQKAARKKK